MRTYGVAICKGGQGKSTTVSTVARLCALSGARVLVVDLAQPGTTTASLRDIWPDSEHGDLSTAMLAFRTYPAGVAPEPEQVHEAFAVQSQLFLGGENAHHAFLDPAAGNASALHGGYHGADGGIGIGGHE